MVTRHRVGDQQGHRETRSPRLVVNHYRPEKKLGKQMEMLLEPIFYREVK